MIKRSEEIKPRRVENAKGGDGEATLDDNGEEEVLKAGDVNICKDGCGHGTRNNGSEDLVMIALILNTL